MQITISKLTDSEWVKYKKIRLEALKQEPSAFASSFEDDVQLPDEQWKKRLQRSHDNNQSVMLFAKDGDRVIGMIGAFWSNKEKIKHIANIFGVYVNSDYRGKGIGNMLMETLLDNLARVSEIEKYS